MACRLNLRRKTIPVKVHVAVALSLFPTLFLAGCRTAPTGAGIVAVDNRQQIDDARRDLNRIPPPSKNVYMAVNDINEWQNPSLTVQEKMISIHVLMPDANPSELGKGTMLRPEAARRQILTIDPANLAEALNSIPKEAWPYGRVVAIEEAHDAPQSALPQLRRTIETAIDTLQSVGVVADEWSNNKPLGVR